MPRARSLAVVVVALAIMVPFGLVVVAARRDAPVPSGMELWVEPGRSLARERAGPVGMLPFRFVEAKCATDQRAVSLEFESVAGLVRSYAVVGMPAGSAGGYAIVGVSSQEYASSSDHFSATLVAPCVANLGGSALPTPSP